MSKNNCNRLSLEERIEIKKYIDEGLSLSKTAYMMGRGKNTIVKEVSKNGGILGYDPYKSNINSVERHKKANLKRSISSKKQIEENRSIGREFISPYVSIKQKLECLEMQIEILIDIIKDLKNGEKN